VNPRHRSRMARLLVAGCAVAGCSLDETTPAPGCVDGRSVLIVAQSVPGAAYVPCIAEEDSGWRATSVHVDEEGSSIRFALGGDERASARLEFSASCGGTRGRPIETELDGVDAWELTPAGRRYEFDAGCLVVRVDEASASAAADALIDSIVLVDRELIQADVSRTFIDEEL
jgi:hypothetical protein